jgi:hypothetical protein
VRGRPIQGAWRREKVSTGTGKRGKEGADLEDAVRVVEGSAFGEAAELDVVEEGSVLGVLGIPGVCRRKGQLTERREKGGKN